MLQQLCTNNNLRSWNIFEGKNGQICCNIQFDVCDIIGDSQPVHDPTCSYRRVSKQQQARNLTRVARYRNRTKVDHYSKKDQYTNTDHLSIPQNKKRKCDSNTPEQNRQSNDELDIDKLDIDSPEACVVDKPVCHNELVPDFFSDSIHGITTSPSTNNSNMEYVDMVQDLSTSYETVQCEAFDAEADEKRHPTYYTDTAKTSFSPPPESPSNPLGKSHDPVLYCPCCEDHMTVTHECTIEFDTNSEEPNTSHTIGTHSSFPPNSNPPNDYPPNDAPPNPEPDPPDIPRPWADLTPEEQTLKFLEMVKSQFEVQKM
jgi:hypothetical protein